MEGLLNGLLGVEGEASIDLGGDLARDDLEDLLAELDEKAVERAVDLLVEICAVLLAVCDGDVHELGILLLLRRSEDQGRVRGGILWPVLANGCKKSVWMERHDVVDCPDCGVREMRGGVCWDGGVTDRQSHLDDGLASCIALNESDVIMLTRIRDDSLEKRCSVSQNIRSVEGVKAQNKTVATMTDDAQRNC